MTRARSPAALALTDQAHAAARDGSAILTALAASTGGPITTGVPDGPVADLLAQFVRRYLAGDLGSCPHLAHGPQPSLWMPSRPGKLRCLPCAQRASNHARSRCDHCRTPRRRLHPGLVMVPPIVLEDLTGAATAVGPVGVIFASCHACSTTTEPR